MSANTCNKHPQCLEWIRKGRPCCAICGEPFPGSSVTYDPVTGTITQVHPVTPPPAEATIIRTFAVYREQASRTDGDHDLQYYVGGLSEEAGEIWRLMKREAYHRHPPAPREAYVEEIGDVLWLLDQFAKHKGITLEEAAAANIQKLWRRFPDGFSEERSLQRQLDGEKKYQKLDGEHLREATCSAHASSVYVNDAPEQSAHQNASLVVAGDRPEPKTDGQQFRRAREDAGFTMGDVAEKLQISVVQVSDFERDISIVPLPSKVYWFALNDMKLTGATK